MQWLRVRKRGEDGRTLLNTKIKYLENEKSFLDEIKTSFIVFEWLSCGDK